MRFRRGWRALLGLLALMGCTATGQDIYIGSDIVAVIPQSRAVAFLQSTVRAYHTGYECRIYSNGIQFPMQTGVPTKGLFPYGSIRARTVWAAWDGGRALTVLAEGETGLLGGDRCILHIHPNPGPLGTRPPPDKGMQTALEAIVSLGAQYKAPNESSDGSSRSYVGLGSVLGMSEGMVK